MKSKCEQKPVTDSSYRWIPRACIEHIAVQKYF